MECDEVDLSTRDNVSNSDEEGEGENDDVDATSMGLQLKMAKINPPVKRGFFSRLIGMFSFFNLFSNLRPGHLYPSLMTTESYYDISNKNRGIALIFNHENVNGHLSREGTRKDGDDLQAVLKGLQFDVRTHMNYNVDQIKKVLYDVSREDHSNNDCLLVTVMTHGKKDGNISATDEDYPVEDLWENFLGENCKSLIGKPKLFFIQACRGAMVDPGALYMPNPIPINGDEVDAAQTGLVFVIPKVADLLVMYSTAEDYVAFRSQKYGSWFIQALCEELKTNQQDDLLRILTAVNRRVAFGKQASSTENKNLDAAKQMPNFLSMLTKTLYFPFKKSSSY